jgi:hypothetical protein
VRDVGGGGANPYKGGGANPYKSGGGIIRTRVGRGAAPIAVVGFWRPGGVAAPPTKEGRGKGSDCSKHWLNLCWYLHNETKCIRRMRKIKISAIGVGGD